MINSRKQGDFLTPLKLLITNNLERTRPILELSKQINKSTSTSEFLKYLLKLLTGYVDRYNLWQKNKAVKCVKSHMMIACDGGGGGCVVFARTI